MTILAALRHPRVTVKGAVEFQSSMGMTYDDERAEAYDFGREAAHVLTFRKWEA